MTFPKAKDKPIYDKISEYFANAADLGGGRQKSHIEAEERKKKQSQKASKASSIELNGSFSSNSEESDHSDSLWKSQPNKGSRLQNTLKNRILVISIEMTHWRMNHIAPLLGKKGRKPKGSLPTHQQLHVMAWEHLISVLMISIDYYFITLTTS